MDRILLSFLENSRKEAGELQSRSRVLRIDSLPPPPPSRYVCVFRVPYLGRSVSGIIETRPGPVICAIHFPDDYLRSGDPRLPLRVVSMLTPTFVHPNVSGHTICLGSAFLPGTSLGELIWQLFEIVTYRNCSVDERNALDPIASRFFREHPEIVNQLPRPPLFQEHRKMQIAVKTT